ncbi:unnamed protein product [Lota lota]
MQAAWWRGWPRLSVSAPVPQRAPARVKGGRGLMVPAQMSSIHFPASAYGQGRGNEQQEEYTHRVNFSNSPAAWTPKIDDVSPSFNDVRNKWPSETHYPSVDRQNGVTPALITRFISCSFTNVR